MKASMKWTAIAAILLGCMTCVGQKTRKAEHLDWPDTESVTWVQPPTPSCAGYQAAFKDGYCTFSIQWNPAPGNIVCTVVGDGMVNCQWPAPSSDPHMTQQDEITALIPEVTR